MPQSTSTLHERLCAELKIDESQEKTTHRDLLALERAQYVRHLKMDDDLRKNFWLSTSPGLGLTLLPTEAMSLSSIIEHAARFGLQAPPRLFDKLVGYVGVVMDKVPDRKLDLVKRITTGTRFQLLQPGRVDPAHLERIQKALWYNEPLKVTYRPRDVGDGVLCIYHLKPLALSYQDSNIYLSAYVLEEQWPPQHVPMPGDKRGKYSSNGPNTQCALMLHRVVAVEDSSRHIPGPPDFDVNSPEAQKHLMTIHGDDPICLRLRLGANLHNRLCENPLTQDQSLKPSTDGKWDLECRIQDTQGLRLFLLSNADEIEVLEPLDLRAHVRDALRRAAKLYADD
jgi:hypothetical protein